MSGPRGGCLRERDEPDPEDEPAGDHDAASAEAVDRSAGNEHRWERRQEARRQHRAQLAVAESERQLQVRQQDLPDAEERAEERAEDRERDDEGSTATVSPVAVARRRQTRLC